MKRVLYILLFCGTLIGCASESGEPQVEENTAPGVPSLVFPADNELCTETNLNLQWSAAVDGEGDAIMYLLEVSNDAGFTDVFHESTISQTSKELNFDSGEDYYWRVKAIDDKNASSDFSSVNSFYSEGIGNENHVPFSPGLIAPLQESSIVSGSIKLEWSSVDLDTDDVLTFDVYIGNNSSDLTLESNGTDITDTFYTISIGSGITSFWRVDVKDSNGGITIGQVWEFTTM